MQPKPKLKILGKRRTQAKQALNSRAVLATDNSSSNQLNLLQGKRFTPKRQIRFSQSRPKEATLVEIEFLYTESHSNVTEITPFANDVKSIKKSHS